MHGNRRDCFPSCLYVSGYHRAKYTTAVFAEEKIFLISAIVCFPPGKICPCPRLTAGAADLIIVGQFAGTYQQSGVATGSQLFNLVTMVITGLTMGVTVFVAQNNGAGKMQRSVRALSYGIKTALAAGAVMGALAFLKGDMLASVFSGQGQVMTYAHRYLKAYAIDCLLTAVLFCFVGFFNGCGKLFL